MATPRPDPDRLRPPRDPGIRTGADSQVGFWIMVVCLAIFVIGVVVVAAATAPNRPSPNELCASHNGVRGLSSGNAICRDGFAGRADV